MKIINLKLFVAFVLVLQLVMVSPMNAHRLANAESNTLKEELIHEFTENTWAYNSLTKSPNGELYLSHMKDYSEISVKKLGNSNWNEIAKVTKSATGDAGFYGGADIAVSNDNLIHIAFAYTRGDSISGQRGIKYGVYQNGSWTFQTVEGLTDPRGWKNTRNQKIAVDSNGKVHIVYEYSDSNDPRKYEIRYATNQSGTWGSKTLITGTSTTDEVHQPQIKVDNNNSVHITYVKEDNQNDYFGNLYYLHKKTSDTEFAPTVKIVDAIADQKNYNYTPFAVDSLGKVHFSFYEGNIWAEDYLNETFTTYYQTNQMGDWNRETVYSDQAKFSYPVQVQIVNSKPTLLMYSESKDWPPSELGFFAMIKEGETWKKGTKVVSPSLIDVTPRELRYATDSSGNHVVVMLDDGLRKISYLTGSDEDYGLISEPPISSNANLSNLFVGSGSLNPGFSSGVTSYTTNVGNTVESIQVTPVVADANARVTVNGISVISGSPSQPISLQIGENVIQVVVTAQDGTPKTYMVTVYRAPSNNANLAMLTTSVGSLTPVFDSSVKNYNLRVPFGTEQIQFTPTIADMHATVVVNGNSVDSGQHSAPIRLNPGVNQIPVIVTAQDGTTATYMVSVTRNQPPATTDKTYIVDENVQTGTSVGFLQASDLDLDSLSYTILSGNTNGVFDLNPSTGEMKVANGSLLDYESTKSYSLVVQVTDGIDQATMNVTINVRDLNDNHPIAKGFTNAINENSAVGTSVGQVTATDSDVGSLFTYTITAGNTDGAFKIDASNGEITVADSNKLDYETTKRFTLTVQVSDGLNKADTSVIIDLRNVNDNIPILNDAEFQVDENAAIGTVVGAISGTDADGDILHYQIIGGNEAGAFTIHPITGEIVVTNSSLLDYETKTTYSLLVQASDENVPVTLSPYGLLTSLFANPAVDLDISNITIHVNDLNDNRPVPQGFTATIDENTAKGTSVGSVTATDADAGSQFTYSITAGNTEGAFAINANSGEVTVADASKLDYETIKRFTLSVRVSDGSNTADTTVTVKLSNLNDNVPVMNDDLFSIEENAINGTVVGTISGTDADEDSLSYRIVSGNETGAFELDASSGKISVADGSKLDFETKASYELKVQVSDSSGADTATITIDVEDLNDNQPVPQGFTENVEENTANGTVIGTVTATDADAGSHFTYSLTAGNEQGAFAIDAASGEVTVADASKLDYEIIKSFTLTVQVSDGTHAATTIVNIHLKNVNDNLPIAEAATFVLDENAANGTEVGTVSAIDADREPLNYRIVSGNETGAFTIDAATGKITVADSTKLDYESKKTFTLTVQVADGKNTADASIVVNLNNLNDNTPVAEAATFTIQENAAKETAVGKVAASDADEDSLSYRILSGNETGAFSIDEATGKIVVAQSSKLDYEKIQNFTLTVQVSDGEKTTETLVIIHLSNLNDNTPVAENAVFSIYENIGNGTEVGTVNASDADGNSLSFSIVSGNEIGAFMIDAATGKITVADGSRLDYEAIKSFKLTIQVSDQANTADSFVTIDLTNLNDNTPVAESAAFTINENAENGTKVGTVTADDADGDTLTYKILSGNETGAFVIDESTGEITVADSSKLDYETVKDFTLAIQVSDRVQTSDTIVTIHLKNLNDHSPVVEDVSFAIDENTANGIEVGTVAASDADGDALTFSIVSEDEKDAFTIDAASGKITVTDSSQLDYEKMKSFKLKVRVSDGSKTEEATVSILLNNLNDNTPKAKDATFTINENAVNGSTVGTVTASDADGDALHYQIVAGNDAGVFAIDPAIGKLTVADSSKLDYEILKSFTLTVKVSDGINTTDITMTINVDNLNDNTPVAEDAAFTIDENSAIGTVVGKIKASDADLDTLSYQILSGNETGGFQIDPATGKLTVADKRKLDYELIQTFTLSVQVSDGEKTTVTTVIINLNNLNDNKPVAVDTLYKIDENVEKGTVVGIAPAIDFDGDFLHYQIVSGNETGAFKIDKATGIITVADSSQLDFEKVTHFTLKVKVSESVHSTHSQVKIDLNNVNDNSPIAKDSSFSVDEKAENGTVIGSVTASDADGDEIQFSITTGNDNGIFAVNKKTGEITLAKAELLDAATKAVHDLTIKASDGERSADITVNVQVLSSDVTLSHLTSNKGKFNPEFKSGITQYTMNVGENIDSIKLTPTTTNAKATMEINGKLAKSGSESEAISLDVGENIITIEVTAENGQKATYTITVTRLKTAVNTVPIKSGKTVTVSDEQVNLIDQQGTLVVELKKELGDVESIQFTAQQLKTLIERQAKVKVKKADVELLIPAANFTAGEDLVISLEQVDRNPVKLPSSDLATGAIYDFTIKLGGKIISQFDYDIELAFPVDHLNVAHPEELKVFYWNPDKRKWELVGGTYENGKIKAMTNHFSTYGVFHPNQFAESPSALPETASNMYNWLFAGMIVLLLGGTMVIRQRVRLLEK